MPFRPHIGSTCHMSRLLFGTELAADDMCSSVVVKRTAAVAGM